MMKDAGIKEIVKQVGGIADTKLMGRESCATFTDKEIVDIGLRNMAFVKIETIKQDGGYYHEKQKEVFQEN
jgi:hypothetical protein